MLYRKYKTKITGSLSSQVVLMRPKLMINELLSCLAHQKTYSNILRVCFLVDCKFYTVFNIFYCNIIVE